MFQHCVAGGCGDRFGAAGQRLAFPGQVQLLVQHVSQEKHRMFLVGQAARRPDGSGRRWPMA
jgi:hypothetical protein